MEASGASESTTSIRFSLRFKLIVLIALAVVVTGVVLVLHNFRRSRASLQAELRKRGTVIAQNLADAAPPLLVASPKALAQLCASFADEDDVAYVMIADPEGKPLAQATTHRGQAIEAAELEQRARRAAAAMSASGGWTTSVAAVKTHHGGDLYAVTTPVVVEVSAPHGPSGDEALFGIEADLEDRETAPREVGKRRLEAVVEVGVSLASVRGTERDLLQTSAVLIGIVVVVGLFFAFIIARFVARPIDQLSRAAQAVAAGDLTVRLPTRPRGDEINKLAAFFNNMAQVLDRQRAEVTQLTQGLAAKSEQLQRANEHKSAFLANMSHELRTPLNSIIGFTRLVIKKAGDALAPQQRENLVKVEKSAVNLLGIINDILDISKIEAGRLDVNPETFALGDLLDEILATGQPLVGEKALRLVKRVPAGLPDLVTDRTRVRQIVINLMSNAIKFTPAGEVAIEVEHDPASDRVTIAVVDTGIGIPREDQAMVFEAFRQVDNSTTRKVGGTGLGLAIVKKLCQLLGGDIALHSEVGKGSRFTVELPRCYRKDAGGAAGGGGREGKAAPAGAWRTAPVERASLGTVVAIDDDPDDALLLRELLVEQGFDVALAMSGAEGLELARKVRPALITLDIRMPGLDGWTVIRQLKADPATRDIPVVIVSIVAMEVQSRGRDLGAVGFVPKPLSARALRYVLHKELQ